MADKQLRQQEILAELEELKKAKDKIETGIEWCRSCINMSNTNKQELEKQEKKLINELGMIYLKNTLNTQ